MILFVFLSSFFLHIYRLVYESEFEFHEVRLTGMKTILYSPLVLLLMASLSFSEDWYSFYIQCVATSSEEASCYQSIRDYLSTEEGRKQAEEIGFKRRLYRDQNQISSQAIVISNRIQQMENFLLSSLNGAEENSVSAYCLQEKRNQIQIIKKHVDKLKASFMTPGIAEQKAQIETDYQLILSLNSRANEVYQQARKCLQ